MSAPSNNNYNDFEKIGGTVVKPVFLAKKGELPPGMTLKVLLSLVDFAMKKYAPKDVGKGMGWMMFAGSARVNKKKYGHEGPDALQKPIDSKCAETRIFSEILNATYAGDIVIGQGMAPCSACMAFYSGWAQTAKTNIVVYGEMDADLVKEQNSWVIFPKGGGVYILLSSAKSVVFS